MEAEAKLTDDDVADIFLGKEEPDEPIEEPTEEVVQEAEPQETDDDTGGDDTQEEEVVEEPTTVEVEYNGTLYEVPNELKDALMQSADYTQKSQANAESRKTLDVQLGTVEAAQKEQAFQTSIQPDVLQVHQLESAVNQFNDYLRQNIDSLSSTDIEKIRFQMDEYRQQRETLVGQLQQKHSDFIKEQEQAVTELLNKSTEVMRAKVPNWGESEHNALKEYAVSQGIPEAQAATVIDPVQIEILWKAKQYDALQANKPAAVKQVSQAPAIKAKSRSPMPKETQDKLNLRKKLKSDKFSPAQKRQLAAEDIGARWG